MRPWDLLFFLIYAVQKAINHFEGLSKIPVRKVLKSPGEEGGYGLTPDQAGSFLTDSALGWYIKALFGLITDNLPLFGYRRKSWLIISSLLAGAAWFWVAVNGTTLQLLLVGLMIVNILVAFSDVVCDGLMVETAQRFENRFALPAGTANRPFQAAQWSGAMFAVLVSAIAGGVIAQFFDLTAAAMISGMLPLGLAVVVALVVKEKKVTWDAQHARKGLLAIAVIVVVASVILHLKDLAPDNPLTPFEPVISALLIIACLLLFIRVPRDLVAPIVLVFFWQAAPFNTDAQYVYQYFTQHNTAFVEALADDQMVVPLLQSLSILLGIADAETIAGQGFQEMFWGSVLGALLALFAIVGALVYRRFLQTTPFLTLFYWCLGGQAIIMLLFLPFPLAGWTSPLWLMAVMALQGFVFMIVLLAMLGFAAKRTPGENQASFFAFLMGMSNLGQMLGIEQVGNRLYTAFGGKTTQWIDGVESTTIADPQAGLAGVIAVSLVYLVFLTALVVWMSRNGHIVTHPEDTEHVF
jgi:MFS family permease